jgi:putative redox protein
MIKAIIHQEPYLTEISSETNSIIADEPITHGGKATGMTPMELLASSLAACTCITLRMYANRKQWDAQSIETNIDIENKDTQTIFLRKIVFKGILSTEQAERLLHIANHCPVHKLLTNTIIINTSIND